MESNPANGDRAPITLVDPGWLFVLAGVGLIAATILIPAAGELAEVQLQRDRALAIEQHKSARLYSYEDYLKALEREEPALVLALAASQLNQIPRGRSLILDAPHLQSIGGSDASVFGALEPAAPSLPERQKVDSILERWTSSDTIRPWILALAVLCLFVGLLPPTTARRAPNPGNPSPA